MQVYVPLMSPVFLFVRLPVLAYGFEVNQVDSQSYSDKRTAGLQSFLLCQPALVELFLDHFVTKI
jgi:hypothetical protein